MENKGPLGPAPAAAVAPGPALSRSRAALLEMLRDQVHPTGLAALSALMGRHENTVRGHLEGLEEAGLVTRERAAPEGRGRPAFLWQAVQRNPAPEYAGLAAALAGSLQRSSQDPAGDAAVAGAEWGRSVARTRPDESPPGPAAARRHVVELMDRLGFGPEADPDARDIRLTRCPLLEVARRHTAIVCNVHSGLVRGALAADRDEDTGVELTPFAEPGACHLRLLAAGPG